MSCRGFIVAGPESGVGKTSVTTGLLRAFRRRGVAVQPFKVGPDFIDPTHHRQAAGRWSHNLDGWMLDRRTNLQIVARHTREADVAVVEGVMGLFDGASGTGESGSTAEMARWLGWPVILVVDAWSMAGSVAALVRGFAEFDAEVDVAGVILNRVAGEPHADLLADAVESHTDVPVLGAIPRRDELAIPERHLGLHLAGEATIPDDSIDAWADAIEATVALEPLADDIARSLGPTPEPYPIAEPASVGEPVRIGVAQDGAFCFYYRDNLDRLEAAGAELVEFSPVDDPLPDGLDGIYIGGGYPEEEAKRLAENRSMLDALSSFCLEGRPVYAECGGLMLLGESIEGGDGDVHRMAGVFPWDVRLGDHPKIDYVEVAVSTGQSFFSEGEIARGHIFHYGEMLADPPASIPRCYRLSPVREEALDEGWCRGRTLASWVHLHFGSNPAWARSFVAACRSAGGGAEADGVKTGS